MIHKREHKHNSVLEKIREKIDARPAGKASVAEGTFLLLSRISDQLAVQNHLLKKLIEKPSDIASEDAEALPAPRKKWWKL